MLDRRQFLQFVSLSAGGCFLGASRLSPLFASSSSNAADMTLTVQTWTFRLFNIDEAIKKIRETGVGATEISGGILVDGKRKRAAATTPEERKWLKSVLEENQVRAVSLGGSQGTPREFDFAAEMGCQYMQGEPPFEKLAEISKRAEEYKIRFALHNHAEPNKYWNYKETLNKLDDCTSWLGFCPDTGHMMRSGIDPLTAIKDLEGKIFTIHLKDLNDTIENLPKKELHDVPWGTGKGQVKEILSELFRQKFRGLVIVEYEYDWENNGPEVAKCAKYFRETLASLR